MRASATPRSQAPPSARRLGGDIRRTLQVGALAIVVSAGIGLVALLGPPLMTKGKRALTEADLRTGSMLVVSPDSSFCQERTIDNDTWRIHSGPLVDCEDAFAKSAGAPASGSRLDLIREGFRRK